MEHRGLEAQWGSSCRRPGEDRLEVSVREVADGVCTPSRRRSSVAFRARTQSRVAWAAAQSGPYQVFDFRETL